MPMITIGILTHNRKDAVLGAIESAFKQAVAGTDLEVVVVDNASSDGTAEAIRRRYPAVKVIRLPRNLGCPGGRNHVYANSLGDYIVNVDDDGFLGDDAVRHVVDAFSADARVGIVAMRQVFVDEPDCDRTVSDKHEEVANFFGGVSAFRRSMLEEIGCYPEDFFLFSEEAYLALKAMDAGYRIVSVPESIMWHPRVGSSASTRWDYYRYRNRFLLITRLFPLWQMLVYLPARIVSHFVLAVKRRSVAKWAAAVASAICSLPQTLASRQPVRAETVRKYFALRGGTR